MGQVIDLVQALRATLLRDLPSRWQRLANDHDRAVLELIEQEGSDEEVGLHLEAARMLRLCAEQLAVVLELNQ